MTLKRPLKILMMLHMPWKRTLGGARVQLELAEEFEELGHHVKKYSLEDAFLNAPSARQIALQGDNFPKKAAEFVRMHGHRFDIIDCHQGNLPYSKAELDYNGLLVARSVGLIPFYQEFSRQEAAKMPFRQRGNAIGQVLWQWRGAQQLSRCFASLRECDLINVCNADEASYINDSLNIRNKCVTLAFGLTKARQQAFAEAALSHEARQARREVVFVGAWSTRKGSKDWADIVARVRSQVRDARFTFLGTGVSEGCVLSDLNLPPQEWIKIVPHYESEQLPQLLATATVGAFPSYIEGFGFGVLEKLASGLPTVAYDVPGPREMLKHLPGSMVTAGNTANFASNLAQLLTLSISDYTKLSAQALEVANLFLWQDIARQTLLAYEMALGQRTA